MDFESVLNSIEGLPVTAKVDLQAAFYSMAKERDDAMAKVQEATARADALTIDKALSESAYIRDNVSPDPIKQGYAREHFRDRFKVEGGRVTAYTPEGQRMFNGQGQPASVDEAIARLIAADPHRDTLLDKSGASKPAGTQGAQGAPAGAKVMKRSAFNALSPADRMKAVKSGWRIVD